MSEQQSHLAPPPKNYPPPRSLKKTYHVYTWGAASTIREVPTCTCDSHEAVVAVVTGLLADGVSNTEYVNVVTVYVNT